MGNTTQLRIILETDLQIKKKIHLILRDLRMVLSEKNLKKWKSITVENIFLEKLMRVFIKMKFNQFQLKNLTV
jgi:hypothetical protein